MGSVSIDEAKKDTLLLLPGQKVYFSDAKGRVRRGAVKIKEIRCGKKSCTKCPHKPYAYAQYREGKKIIDKYIGVMR